MSERTASLDPPKLFRDAPITEVVVAEITTNNVYWDRGAHFFLTKYTEDDEFLSHSVVIAREDDGEAVALLESWAPRTVLRLDQLSSEPDSDLSDFLGDRARDAWIYQAVCATQLDPSDAELLGRGAGEAAVCLWRYYHDEDADLLLSQRFVLANGYSGFFRIPLVWREGEYQAREETLGTLEA